MDSNANRAKKILEKVQIVVKTDWKALLAMIFIAFVLIGVLIIDSFGTLRRGNFGELSATRYEETNSRTELTSSKPTSKPLDFEPESVTFPEPTKNESELEEFKASREKMNRFLRKIDHCMISRVYCPNEPVFKVLKAQQNEVKSIFDQFEKLKLSNNRTQIEYLNRKFDAKAYAIDSGLVMDGTDDVNGIYEDYQRCVRILDCIVEYPKIRCLNYVFYLMKEDASVPNKECGLL